MTGSPSRTQPVPPRSSNRALGMMFAAGALVGAFAVGKFNAPPAIQPAAFAPVTFDAGVTTTPALSPDGNLVAYASDRHGQRNLDLYVQPFRGGDAQRLTWTPENESDPSFSADGKAIAYASSREEGGVYLIPALGGTARLVAAQAHNPRFSPRENVLAYWTGTPGELLEIRAKTYVVPISGGAHRQILADFSAVQRPVWSPDGRKLIVWGVAPGDGSATNRADFWVTGLERDRAERVGLSGPVSRAGGSLAAVDDMIWTDRGLIFSLRTGWTRNLFRCAVTADGKAEGELTQLAGGVIGAELPAVSRTGQMVFVSGTQRFDVWGLPLDAGHGKATGSLYRITDNVAPNEYPALSPDGGRIAFASPRNGASQIWIRDVAKGEEEVVAAGPGASNPVWLRSGAQIAYAQKTARRYDEYVLDLATKSARKVFEGGYFWDVKGDGSVALAHKDDAGSNNLFTVEVASGKTSLLARAAGDSELGDAVYSPDDRWIAFGERTRSGDSRIYLASALGSGEIPESGWIALTGARENAAKPRFSPDGGVLYFVNNGAVRHEIRGLKFGSKTGESRGESFKVFESEVPTQSLSGIHPRSVGIGISLDKLVFLMREAHSNLWRVGLN